MPDIVYLKNHTAKIKPHERWELWFKRSIPVCYPHVTGILPACPYAALVLCSVLNMSTVCLKNTAHTTRPTLLKIPITTYSVTILKFQSHILRAIAADMITKKAPNSTVKMLTTG
jgi:hypothetical protein